MSFVMRRWYVEPYQRGAGELAADGSIDLMTGESILSFAWLFVYVRVGVTPWYVVRASIGSNGKVLSGAPVHAQESVRASGWSAPWARPLHTEPHCRCHREVVRGIAAAVLVVQDRGVAHLEFR